MMNTLTGTEIDAMDKLVRVQLATTLPGIKPVSLIGTTDLSGHTNLAPFSSVVHIGSNPVLLGMVTRPDVVTRHTLANIIATGSWTINHLTSAIIEQAHHCSARYPDEVSEFDASGLTPYFEEGVTAPFVRESPFRLALALEDLIDIPTNGTKLIVGRVTHVQLPQGMPADDGSVDLAAIGLVASTALDTYFTITQHDRLPYAKPKA
ncbi:flavin reductase family protein [Haloferula chungangensis]|uniref:Flavin reductase family protein n=1 Tax=Haloferula chungangensis TaxID=1048331 RepID=A0ABW2L525_9BACT